MRIWWRRARHHARYSSDVRPHRDDRCRVPGPGRPLSIERLWLDPPGPGEIRVRMVASGVCHSDLHVVDGDWSATHRCRARPRGRGHRGGARRGGRGHRRSAHLVVLVWTAPCRMCRACRRGEVWLCATPRGGGHRRDPADVRAASAGRQPGRGLQRCRHACHAPGRGCGGRDPGRCPDTPRRGRAPWLCRDHRYRRRPEHGAACGQGRRSWSSGWVASDCRR